MMHLNATHCPNLSQEGILNFVVTASKLEHLDIFDNTNLSTLGKETLVEIARERGITVVLRGLTEAGVAPAKGVQHVLDIWKNALT